LCETDQWQVGFRLVVTTTDWPLLTGGRCSGVAGKTVLTVHLNTQQPLPNQSQK
jgi:hypothetical protein